MALIYTYDIVPIILATLLFSLLATVHRILIPNKYTAFLQFKQEENPKRTAESTSIRILYLIIGSIFLYQGLSFSIKQVCMGVFLSCFLNVWPVLIKYQLFKLQKNSKEWVALLGYISFIVASVLVSYFSLAVLLPILKGNRELYWMDNQAITIIATLITIAIPIPLEAILAKFSYVIISQQIDTFEEEIYIVQHQINMPCKKIEHNRYMIENVAKENDINPKLLRTILYLEIFYRKRIYNQLLENFICKFMKKLAISKDISVGIAQIKVSTAEKILMKDAPLFLDQLPKDTYNIQVCGKYLKHLLEEYKNDSLKEYSSYHEVDIYTYLACEYLGGEYYYRTQSVLIYSAVLRSILTNDSLNYFPSSFMIPCNLHIISKNAGEVGADEYESIVEGISNYGIIKQKNFYDSGKLELTVYCSNRYHLESIRCTIIQYNFDVWVQE